MSALPLRARLGAPEECLHAALERARLAASHGALGLAETLLRGVLALDPRCPAAASELASVLVERSLSEPLDRAEAAAWCRWALSLDPADPLAASVHARLGRLGAA